MKIFWIHVGLVSLFAGGIAAGHLYHRHFARPVPPMPDHGGHHDAGPYVDRFRKRLDLSDAQTAKVKEILDGTHKEMETLAGEFHGKFRTLRGRAWTDIRATLTEEQRPEFDKLIEEMEKTHSGH